MQLGTSNSSDSHFFSELIAVRCIFKCRGARLLSSPPQFVTGFSCLFSCLPGQHSMRWHQKASWQISNLGSTTIEAIGLPRIVWFLDILCTDKSQIPQLPQHLPYLRTSKGELLGRDHGEDSQNSNCLHCCLVFLVFTRAWWAPKFPKLQWFGEIGI